jgi:hypothetical protein
VFGHFEMTLTAMVTVLTLLNSQQNIYGQNQ